MANLTYSEQLKHPNWQRKRLEVLNEAGWMCELCESKDVTLNVHHKQYFKGRMAWEYENCELEVLCEICHTEHHEVDDLLKRVLQIGFDPTRTALGLLAGYLYAGYAMDSDLEESVRKKTGNLFDLGVVIHTLSMCNKQTLAKILDDNTDDSERGPILEIMIDQWSKAYA